MKKICFIATTPVTLRTFVVKTAEYLHYNGGYEIFLVSSNDSDFEKKLPSYIHYYPINMSRGINLDGFNAIIKMARFFKKERFDIIQYSTPNASLYASIAGRMARTKNRLYCQWGIRYVGFSGIKRAVFKKIEKIICNNSTYIEPDSKGNLDFSCREGLYDRRKSSVVWNGSACGVDLDKFNEGSRRFFRERCRKECGLGSSIVIGFVGRLEKDKGINELIGAIKKLSDKYDIKLLLVGPEEKTETIDSGLYEWAKNSPKVVFIGSVDKVQKYYAAMDIFTLPSYREGFGSVVIEAEAMGIPVVVTNIPGPTDAMIDGNTGIIVKKGSVDSLAKGLERLIKNEKIRKKYSSNAIKFASNNFDEKKMFKYILEDRDRLLEQNEKQ